MTDAHQVISMGTIICDALKDHAEHRLNPEQAKQIAELLVNGLTDAGLQIVPAKDPR